MVATNTNKKEIEEILQKDLENIYLGNLGTIDADLSLPLTGKYGSQLSWQTGEVLFISNEGKVTRPTYGVGNRDVTLEVTASFAGIQKKKIFIATVLEEEPEHEIIETYPVYIQKEDLEKPLPSVCVVKLDNGEYTTAEVKWSKNDLRNTLTSISGKLVDKDLDVELLITKNQARDTIKPLKTYATKLLPGSVFYDSSQQMLHHLAQVDVNQLLYSFRKVAGIDTKNAKAMTGWDAPECNLKGHTTGHYLSALSFAFYVTNDACYQKKTAALVTGLQECQEALSNQGMQPGFLSAYTEKQFDLLEEYTTYPTIWAPYYTLDKILQGLLDSYQYADNTMGLHVAKSLGDWTTKRLEKLTPEQLSKMWSIYIAGEFGGMISALLRLYHFTKEKKYLETAMLFENDKLFVPMSENYDTLDGIHANQHIPQILGALDIYQKTGKKQYYDIANNFWQMVTKHHAYSIGGVGET